MHACLYMLHQNLAIMLILTSSDCRYWHAWDVRTAGVQTSARLKDGLCVGAPADPDVVEDARRLSLEGASALAGAALSLRSRTACTSTLPVVDERRPS